MTQCLEGYHNTPKFHRRELSTHLSEPWISSRINMGQRCQMLLIDRDSTINHRQDIINNRCTMNNSLRFSWEDINLFNTILLKLQASLRSANLKQFLQFPSPVEDITKPGQLTSSHHTSQIQLISRVINQSITATNLHFTQPTSQQLQEPINLNPIRLQEHTSNQFKILINHYISQTQLIITFTDLQVPSIIRWLQLHTSQFLLRGNQSRLETLTFHQLQVLLCTPPIIRTLRQNKQIFGNDFRYR